MLRDRQPTDGTAAVQKCCCELSSVRGVECGASAVSLVLLLGNNGGSVPVG